MASEKTERKRKRGKRPTYLGFPTQLTAPQPRPTPALSSTPGRGTQSCVPAMPGPPTTGRPRSFSPGHVLVPGDAQEPATSIPPLAVASPALYVFPPSHPSDAGVHRRENLQPTPERSPETLPILRSTVDYPD